MDGERPPRNGPHPGARLEGNAALLCGPQDALLVRAVDQAALILDGAIDLCAVTTKRPTEGALRHAEFGKDPPPGG